MSQETDPRPIHPSVTLPKTVKLVQICSDPDGNIHGLDEFGRVWMYDSHYNGKICVGWKRLTNEVLEEKSK